MLVELVESTGNHECEDTSKAKLLQPLVKYKVCNSCPGDNILTTVWCYLDVYQYI